MGSGEWPVRQAVGMPVKWFGQWSAMDSCISNEELVLVIFSDNVESLHNRMIM